MSHFLTRLGASMLLLTAPLLTQTGDRLHLKYAVFDPATDHPSVATALEGSTDTRLWVVQFADRPTESMRRAVRATGATIHGYLPDNAYVVRMPLDVAAQVRALQHSRWVGHYHPAFRLEPLLLAELLLAEQRSGNLPLRRYNIVVVDKHTDKPGLIAKIVAAGGRIDHEQPGSILLQVTLSGDQLLRVARMDEVLWIDRWTPNGLDMNNARTQGGGNHVEIAGGYTGQGINGHVYEGIEATHADFNSTALAVGSCGTADQHGHCTAGIIFGNGTSHPDARGMAPDARAFYTNHLCVSSGRSRWQIVEELVTQHEVMFTSASWGGDWTTRYTSVSADTDDIIFDHGIPWTQSQANAGSQSSRPEAWAKNVFSIGGVVHFDNSDPLDDSWAAGSASTGPAADGRIKPDLCAYYDQIHCSDLTGSAGYAPGNSFPHFSGTSGATPICAGHNALAIQMFTDGIFGNTLRVPGGSRFQNRPHFTTLKALQIANASQYAFTASSSDNRREHQGWGFPSLRSMWDNRDVHFIVDETDVLTQGNGSRWSVRVAPGQPELKVSMTFAEPAGNPAATLAAINDLSLRVISPSGVQFWGNYGLEHGTASTPGGSANNYDTVENVFVRNPEAGTWSVDVIAPLVVVDSHVETPGVDADYGLVVNGAVFVSRASILSGSFLTFGSGCLGSVQTVGRGCITANEMGTTPPIRLTPNAGYALRVSAPQDVTVLGFELYTASSSGPQSLQTGLYDVALSGKPRNLLVSGSMMVGAAMSWYSANLTSPVVIPAGQPFFLFFQNNPNPIQASIAVPGTGVTYFRNSGPGTSWTSPPGLSWRLRVNCQGSFVAPALASGQIPALGGTYDVSLSRAVPDAGAALFIGGSNTAWALGTLPVSLEPLGATGCALLVSTDIVLGGTTSAQGALVVTMSIPRVPRLLGGEVFHQFFVLDAAANPFGAVLTNGGHAIIGQ